MLDLVERNSSQEHLIQELLDYLMGETDGQPKDPIFTYRLYRILKNFRNAAKIAVTIASQEQENGNYKGAHDILFQSYQDIKKANVPIPLELEKKLSILHSYIIAMKRVSKMDAHVDTALLLDKVSKNIIQFPAHASIILTTTIVKAMRADLKGLAYNWAIVVFRPEYKAQVYAGLARSLRSMWTRSRKWPSSL
jgi:WD repeat-containing protein 19